MVECSEEFLESIDAIRGREKVGNSHNPSDASRTPNTFSLRWAREWGIARHPRVIHMGQTERSLIVILSMHRSGSSLTTGILQALGMSLGPFEVVGANSENPHGYFEIEPILELSRSVQRLAYGFSEDVPDSPETMARFVETRAAWDESTKIPAELIDRGRSLVQGLVNSGTISGFKDPRTALLWPFWQQVLAAFPGLRVLPLVLLRSPHEIAMSLFTRGATKVGYQSCLDITAVHLVRLHAIVATWPSPVPRVRFGGPHYSSDLADAVERCGLIWDPVKSQRLFDRSSVHQTPATIVHEAQRLYDSLCGDHGCSDSSHANLATLEADACSREALYREEIHRTRADREQHRQDLLATQHSLRSSEEARDQAEKQARQNQQGWDETQQRWQETQGELSLAREQLAAALADKAQLQARLDRFEIHPLIGPALRGRRHLVRAVDSFRSREAV